MKVADLAVAGEGGDRAAGGDVGAGVGDEHLRAVDRPAAVARASARVRVAPASEPGLRLGEAEGPQGAGPTARSGTQRSRCSGVPHRTIGIVPRPVWAATVTATAESTRASSSMAIAYESVSSPAPPSSSGTVMPIRPELAERGDDPVGEAALAVELLGDRGDLALRDLAHRGAEGHLLVGEALVHRRAAGASRSAARRWAAASSVPPRGARRRRSARGPASPIRSTARVRPGPGPSRRAAGPRRSARRRWPRSPGRSRCRARASSLGDRVVGELVVGRAHHPAAAQPPARRPWVRTPPMRAGRQDVAGLGQRRRRVDARRPPTGPRARSARAGADVADHHQARPRPRAAAPAPRRPCRRPATTDPRAAPASGRRRLLLPRGPHGGQHPAGRVAATGRRPSRPPGAGRPSTYGVCARRAAMSADAWCPTSSAVW